MPKGSCADPGTWEWGDTYPENLDPNTSPDEFDRLIRHLERCPFHAAMEDALGDGIRQLMQEAPTDAVLEGLGLPPMEEGLADLRRCVDAEAATKGK